MDTPTTAKTLDPGSVVDDIVGTAAASMPAAPSPAASSNANPGAERSSPPPAAGPILTDKTGRTVFDPTKHKANADGSPFVNAAGYFMPIGGRKPKTTGAAPAAVVTPAAKPADPAAEAAAKTAWSATDRAAATPASTPAEKAGDAANSGAPAAEDRGEDAKLAPEQAGELAARCLYTGVGALTGDHATASASGAEHQNLVKVFTAFLRFRGYTVTGWGALGFSVLFFLVDEKRRAVVWAKARALFTSSAPKPERRAQPVAAPAGAATPARAEVVEPTAPVPAAPADSRRDWLKGLAAD